MLRTRIRWGDLVSLIVCNHRWTSRPHKQMRCWFDVDLHVGTHQHTKKTNEDCLLNLIWVGEEILLPRRGVFHPKIWFDKRRGLIWWSALRQETRTQFQALWTLSTDKNSVLSWTRSCESDPDRHTERASERISKKWMQVNWREVKSKTLNKKEIEQK